MPATAVEIAIAGTRTLRRMAQLTSSIRQRQPKRRATPGSRNPILERDRPAVRLGNLTAEREADARSVRLGREERHEQVRRIRQALAFIVHIQLEPVARALPSHRDLPARL